MEHTGYTTVEQRRRDDERFAHFMDVTTKALITDARNNIALYSKQNGEKLEYVVLDKMRSIASEFDISPEKIRKSDKQHFPDILLDDTTYGVEVKSVKDKTWTSTGSSIVETLRESEIEKVFLMFGRLSAPDIDFRCKPYEECLSEIAVTHSPRYLIDMNMSATEKTIFEKMGTSYEQFRKMGDAQINLVRQHYRKKYKSRDKKSMPWWIGDEPTIATHPPGLDDPSCEFRMLSDLSEDVKRYFRISSYALFPEILGTDQDKFRKPSLWLCSRFSIICSNVRDFFTAGGTVNIYLDDKLIWKNVPKVVANLALYIHEIKERLDSNEETINDIINFSSFNNGSKFIFSQWEEIADNYIAMALSKATGKNCGFECVEKQQLTIKNMLSIRNITTKTINNKNYYYFVDY